MVTKSSIYDKYLDTYQNLQRKYFLKIAKITPIFKSEDVTYMSNYQPV